MTARVRLSIAFAPGDEEPIVAALREGIDAPLHLRTDHVRARDFADAPIAERVSGLLERRVIELTINAGDMDALVARVVDARRRRPVRWWAAPLLGEGSAS